MPKGLPSVNIIPFSRKQRQILSWWHPLSPVKDADGIIADGSIRSGKTFSMSLSFVTWAFANFDGKNLAFCGKTVGALRRNVIRWLKAALLLRGYHVEEKRSENLMILSKGGRTNFFYMFGGQDESSQDLIQGITLAGIFFDEAALMPESFVNQGTGRCSEEGAKFWFNCNPDSPSHWFKREWLDRSASKNLIHLHFVMDDNPSLSEKTRKRYEALYAGVFYKRFILGLWVMAEGAIYDMWDDDCLYGGDIPDALADRADHYIAIDYGTQNATVFLHIIDDGRTVWVADEYYHSGRISGAQRTDSQYASDLEAFCEGKRINRVILDPSAASFKAELRQRGFVVKDADNEVLDGIRVVGTMLKRRLIQIHARNCPNLVREIQSYVWDPKKTDRGKEQPIKKDDHGPDALRYFCKTIYLPYRLSAALQDAA